MNMKKLVALMLALVLCISALPVLAEGTSQFYVLGDKMEDFTVTLSDGSQVSLYGLLSEKKAVLINFWASWCQPCKMEFPYLQKAYNQMSDEIGVIALSVEPEDTDEIVSSLKKDMELDTLPMGLDSLDLSYRFESTSIPLSIMVDRNGVICFMESGSMPDEDKFLSLFRAFTADDYDQPKLLIDIPKVKPTTSWPSQDELAKVLGLEGMELILPQDDTVWPFTLTEDGTAIRSSNRTVKDSTASFSVRLNANAGEGLAFDYSVYCTLIHQGLYVDVDGVRAAVLAGSKDWTVGFVPFSSDGEHVVEFRFERDVTTDGDAFASVRSLRKISAEETAQLENEASVGVKTLEGDDCTIEVVSGQLKPILFQYSIQGQQDATPGSILESDSLTLRIRIGKDVDVNQAFVNEGDQFTLLSNLKADELGYLYTTTKADAPSEETVAHRVQVYPSLLAFDANTRPAATLNLFDYESEADLFAQILDDIINTFIGSPDFTVNWVYEDGSPRQDAAESADEEVAEETGDGTYIINVTDEDGNPIPGVMVQVCDEATCQLIPTGADGKVTHVAPRYAYEIHILKVPAGYQKVKDTFTMPKAGGEITIQLPKE